MLVDNGGDLTVFWLMELVHAETRTRDGCVRRGLSCCLLLLLFAAAAATAAAATAAVDDDDDAKSEKHGFSEPMLRACR